MTYSNKITDATFDTFAEADAYVKAIRLLADLYPSRDIRSTVKPDRRYGGWIVRVQCLVSPPAEGPTM